MGISGSGQTTALMSSAARDGRFRTFAVVLVALVVLGTGAGFSRIDGQTGGSIKGRVTMPGAPAPGTLKVTTDETVCGLSVTDEVIVADKTGAVAHALVSVKGLPWSGAPASPHVVNKGCRFAPHVTVARPGTTLEVTSDDQTLHTTHLYAADGRSLFNIALPMPGILIKRPLEKNTGVLRLACDTHPWMRGFVAVSPDRAVVTGIDGVFQIDDVPPGSHEVNVWHESLRASPRKVTVTAGQTVEVQFVLAAR